MPLVERILHDSDIPSDQLELEVTEGVVQTNQRNLAVFERLRNLGVSVAIDDFGTGYSSFASLKHLNIDQLKIDKYFIDDIVTDNKARQLVGSMISMAHSLGYRVIAEGVETQEQLQVVSQLGCDIVQGYYFSRPVPADEMAELLRQKGFSILA